MGSSPQSVLYPAILTRPRPFGDDLAPPRPLYFTHIPAILAFAGVLSWIIGNEFGLIFGSSVAAAVSLFTLWEWLFRRAPTRFSTLLGMSLLLGYGVGTLNTWLTLPRVNLTLAQYMGMDEAVLPHGIAMVLISSACLYFLGEIFEKPLFGRDFLFRIDARTRTLVYVGTCAILAGYLTHSVIIGGAAGGGGRTSVAGSFLLWLYIPLTAIAVAAFVTASRTADKVFTAIAALVLLMMFSVMGRRATIYASVEIILLLQYIGFRWREKILRNLILVAALGTIVIMCALTFMLLRISERVGTHKEIPVAKRIQAAYKLAKQGEAYTLAGRATQENFQTRTFVLPFLANIADASTRKTPALGRDALSMFQMAIPHVFYPEKSATFSEEGLVDQQFGFGYGDQPNSILTAGAADFGLIGIVIYPLVIVVAVRLVFDFTAGFLRVVPLTFVALSVLNLFLQTEGILAGYFDSIRDSFLFGIILALFLALPRFGLRHDEWR